MAQRPLSRASTRWFARKSIEAVQREAGTHGLKRVLGPVHLAMLGVGCTVGAGIYVMPGNAAANFAGPAVMLSFLLAGVGCSFIALCYAELCAAMPVSGAAYTYCYAALGEVFAWALGWLLLFEFGLSCAMLAVGFSSYFVSLAHDFGFLVPENLAAPLIHASPTARGNDRSERGYFSLCIGQQRPGRRESDRAASLHCRRRRRHAATELDAIHPPK
jgi:APA family basic amino acid/polyamine antiporter